jgi:cellulose synthase/poly-beta-1,6-N-acetylglucosamine synthase-like glycosyltransferase
LHHLWLWAYLLIGPAAWALMWIGLLLGRSRMNRLGGSPLALPPAPPTVSIVIPAKDEGPAVADCLASVLAQDYPRFDVIAIDDRSTDQTGSILDSLAAANPSLRVLHVAPGDLPEGWLGKCHALHLATRSLTCDWILFVDSDVTLVPAALRTALSAAIDRKYDAVTLMTRLDARTFLERLVLPPAAMAWAAMNVISLTNEDDRPDIAVANGQFLLVRRDLYESVGNHAAVRDQITEDVELMRLLKSRGARVRILLGKHLAATRMHANFPQMLHGWGRIYSGSVRRNPARILAAMLFIVISGLSLYPAIAWSLLQPGRPWPLAATAHAALMTAYLAFVYRASGNRIRHALLYPVAAAYLLIFMTHALRLCRTGRYAWRGTVFAAGDGENVAR